MKYKFIVFGGIALIVVVGILSFIFGGKIINNQLNGTVIVWSFEPSAHWKEVIVAFQIENPKVKKLSMNPLWS